MDNKKVIGMLKAYFTENFMGSVHEGGCDTCGYGGIAGMTLEDIYSTIDEFEKKFLEVGEING